PSKNKIRIQDLTGVFEADSSVTDSSSISGLLFIIKSTQPGNVDPRKDNMGVFRLNKRIHFLIFLKRLKI
ncbi:MAG: hypothetical protein KKC86_02685, partial [Bacteroidetes bacterium]|nr:hypothetical protein [Bacteroidota bacterium]